MYYHFSENPDITIFEPRLPASFSDQPPLVWAIDEEHAPLYYFPRECPRVAFWQGPDTTKEDDERFISYSEAKMIIAVEARWLETIRSATIYKYTFPPDTFTCFDENAGYYTSLVTVKPLSVEPIGDLLDRLIEAKVEIRITPSLFPLQNTIKNSTLNFSMIRMRNAKG